MQSMQVHEASQDAILGVPRLPDARRRLPDGLGKFTILYLAKVFRRTRSYELAQRSTMAQISSHRAFHRVGMWTRTADPASDLSTVAVTMNDNVCVLDKLFSESN